MINSTLTGSRSPAGTRRLGTATRISASLLRRLSAFFRSVSDQDPKAAKFAVLPPGHAGFPNRVKRSEGSDTTPTSHVQKVLHTERKKQQHHQIANRVAQPSGAATPRNSDAHKRIAVPKALCVLWEYPRPRPKSGKTCRSDTRPGDVRERAERSEGSDTTPVRNAPVSPCVPLCAIFRRKTSVYPISPVKANVGRLCEKLKNAMKSGLGRSCSGNFLAIVAGTILSEKLNLTGGFFEWRRPFDFSTDRL